ncbi:MAG: DUF624 domain-containing protein [Dactylosporangium sp.]|nr:DUF624 domain-containing protein [Dactylosporangium sp.]
MSRAPREFGSGPLSRGSAFIYTLMVVEFMLVVASLPGLVPLYFVVAAGANAVLVALCAIPFGPALSAAIYALRHRSRDLADLRPMRQFWRGYRLNLRDVLPVWLVGLLWLFIVVVTLANFWAAGVPAWWAVILGLVGVIAVLWLTNALIVTSLFSFRTVDAMRLAWELIPRRPLVTLGNAGVLLGAGVLAVLTNELLVGLLASTFLMALLATSRPLIEFVAEEHTTG